MNFVGIRDLSCNTKSVIAGLKEDDKVIVTDNGKPVAFMMPIDGKNFEDTLFEMQRMSAINALHSAQQKAAEDFPDGISDEEIQAEIDAVRRGE